MPVTGQSDTAENAEIEAYRILDTSVVPPALLAFSRQDKTDLL
jgi:hypothetical protein